MSTFGSTEKNYSSWKRRLALFLAFILFVVITSLIDANLSYSYNPCGDGQELVNRIALWVCE